MPIGKFAAIVLHMCLCFTALAQDSAETAAPPYLQSDLALLVGNVQRPNGLAYHDGSLYTVCNGDWTIYKVNAETGESVSFVFGVHNGNSLIAENTDSGFDLYVPDPETGTLWQLDERRQAPVEVVGEIAAPWGITRLDEETLLVSDTRENAILVVDVATRGETMTLVDGLRAPTGIAHADGLLYIANGGSARRGIEVYDLYAGELKSLVSGLQSVSNLALGADGQLYFAYALGTRGVVGRVDPDLCLEDGCSGDDIEPVVFSDLPAPLAITLSDDMRLFLHSRYRPEIYRVQLPAESA